MEWQCSHYRYLLQYKVQVISCGITSALLKTVMSSGVSDVFLKQNPVLLWQILNVDVFFGTTMNDA